MTDFADLSSNNGPVDLPAYARAGHRTIVLKATEGTGYGWPAFRSAAERAHAAGLEVGAYHFLHQAGSTEAEHFLATVRPVLPLLSFLVLDFEADATAASGSAFMQALEAARTGKQLWVYGGYRVAEERLPHRPGWLLWQAAYGRTTVPAPPPGWPPCSAWQFTSTFRAPWAAAGDDLDMSHDYRRAPAPAPNPAPVQEDDMASIITCTDKAHSGATLVADQGLIFSASTGADLAPYSDAVRRAVRPGIFDAYARKAVDAHDPKAGK